MVYDGPTIEGTKLYKRDGYYYIFSPAGGVATGWQTVLRAKEIFGPYEEKIVMAWTADGWPVIGEDPDGDGVGQKWPYRSLWDCPNVLLQKFQAESFTVTARLTFRPNPDFAHRNETASFVVMGKDYAGLRITDGQDGAKLQYIRCLSASKGAEESATDLAELPYTFVPLPHAHESKNVPLVRYSDRPETCLWVKLEVSPRPVEGNVPQAICNFSWSLDGKTWNPAGAEFQAKPELWIGAKWGFFCNRFAPKNDSGSLDVELL